MSGYQATGRFLIARLSQAAEAKSIYPVALGCAVSARVNENETPTSGI